MKKNLLFPFIILAVLFTSCSKSLEDRLVGTWKLDDSYRRVFFGRDHFDTGYESGVFSLEENGNASYTSSTDTLTGFWRSGVHTNNYYNNGSGQWESRSMRYLRISLRNYPQNQFLEWEFDDFNFRSSWRMIRAEQYSLSNDRVYEFVRQ